MERTTPVRPLTLAIAIAGGLVFIGSLLWFLASYVWRFDTLPEADGGTTQAILVDLGLFTAFALHHSVLAREPLKAWVRRQFPAVLERSIYVWIASALFVVTCGWWQPVEGTAWRVTGFAEALLRFGQIAGLVLTVVAARRLDMLDLAGVRQVLPSGPRLAPRALDSSGPFGLVRHPIYFGWLLIVWLAPWMNGTRLVFAAVSTAYLAMAIPFEERDLRRTFGSAYTDYARVVRKKMLPFIY